MQTHNVTFRICFALLLMMLMQPGLGLDTVSERLFVEQLKAEIDIGNVIELSDGQHVFLAIDTPAVTPRVRGGVIFVHSIGEHADWQEIITPLRADLPKYGWRTLSVQLPLIDDVTRQFNQYADEGQRRIRAAIEHLNQAGVYNIALVGHGAGAGIALAYISSRKDAKSDFTAIVLISMYIPMAANWDFELTKAVREINVHLLEVYGSMDADEVLAGVKERKSLLLNPANTRYQQMPFQGANHAFSGLEHSLVKRVRTWLNKRAPSFEIKQTNSSAKNSSEK